MLVREVMTTPAVTVQRSASVREAIALLCERDLTAVPVVEAATGRLVGIVSEIDLLHRAFEANPHAVPRTAPPVGPATEVGEVMSPRVLTARKTSDVAEVAALMMRTGAESVPVLEGQEVVGTVSRRDLLRVLAPAAALPVQPG